MCHGVLHLGRVAAVDWVTHGARSRAPVQVDLTHQPSWAPEHIAEITSHSDHVSGHSGPLSHVTMAHTHIGAEVGHTGGG